MKNIFVIILLAISSIGLTQTGKPQTQATLPSEEVTIIATMCTALEITIYEGTSTVSMSGVGNTKFLAAGLDTIPPAKLNQQNSAYIMIVVNDDFYMDAELSYGENKYLIFKKDGKKYYNKLNEQGERFFKQVLGEEE
jgi:hypothetical protein